MTNHRYVILGLGTRLRFYLPYGEMSGRNFLFVRFHSIVRPNVELVSESEGLGPSKDY